MNGEEINQDQGKENQDTAQKALAGENTRAEDNATLSLAAKNDSPAFARHLVDYDDVTAMENSPSLSRRVIPYVAGVLSGLFLLSMMYKPEPKYGNTGTDAGPTPSPSATVPSDKKALQGMRNGVIPEGMAASGQVVRAPSSDKGVRAMTGSGAATSDAAASGAVSGPASGKASFGMMAAGGATSQSEFLHCQVIFEETIDDTAKRAYRYDLAAGAAARDKLGATCPVMMSGADSEEKIAALIKNGVQVVRRETEDANTRVLTNYSVGPFPDTKTFDKQSGEKLRLYFNAENNRIQDERYHANGNLKYIAYFSAEDVTKPVKGPNGEPHVRRFEPDGSEQAQTGKMVAGSGALRF